MMSHDNLTWMANKVCKYLGMTSNDSLVSYLPLSHSAAQMVDVWMAMSAGATVNFADRSALKGTLVHTLKEVRPTFFLGVPRVFEKMMEKMQELGKSAPAVKRMVAQWAKKTGKCVLYSQLIFLNRCQLSFKKDIDLLILWSYDSNV